MNSKRTPLMIQFDQIKLRYPDALLLFRVGDFYETFEDDAVKCSDTLNIVLTSRANIKLAGFPHHALNNYLPRLVKAGFRVAICDQMEDTKKIKGKGIIKRVVTNVVTPGVTFNDNILQAKSNNFLAALHFEKDKSGVAFLDISTGEFLVAEENNSYVKELINKFNPSEIIFQKKKKDKFEELLEKKFFSYEMDDWVFQYDNAYEKIIRHFKTLSLKGFGVENLKCAIIAAGVIFNYLDHTQNSNIRHISSIRRIDPEKYVWMDDFTIKSLEILEPNHSNGRSLLDVLDSTFTVMGARLLKRWIVMPIKYLSTINARYDLVEAILRSNFDLKLINLLQSLGDIERLTSKVILEKITPRELLNLSLSLERIERIKKLLNSSKEKKLNLYSKKFPDFKSLSNDIRNTLSSDPSHQFGKGNVIAPGFSRELDDLRALVSSVKKNLELISLREKKRTGIPLKILNNNIFGYYIEIRNAYKDKVPKNWTRKQTLVNSERYSTEELKEHEIKILVAEEKILSLENDLFKKLVSSVGKSIIALQYGAKLISHLDIINCFAINAKNNKYVRPIINDSMNLYIKKGRHPVIEKTLSIGTNYIENDLFMDNVSSQILMITGPNMAGKSAFLRQIALIVSMAQIGSFVPAQYLLFGYFDKIFSRVGAFDNISLGESTFMIEMNETASILNNMSKRSLIILDEIGRGTGPIDGISISLAVAEYLHKHPIRPKTIFATHFHELHSLANTCKRIKNFNVYVREIDENVIFMHKVVPGDSTKSLGINVAKMANMPYAVLKRAQEILDKILSKKILS